MKEIQKLSVSKQMGKKGPMSACLKRVYKEKRLSFRYDKKNDFLEVLYTTSEANEERWPFLKFSRDFLIQEFLSKIIKIDYESSGVNETLLPPT